ncbi:solute carrier family 66 member 3-like [Achroia grisella]|uniref:solute carrier family 66 member 3-like n=1 Tax=Achroia grisella TaxID=688607 RepID=UPI0027D2D428|nr:solute carrier family 66 member 3-like [Achroia grisella]
MDVQGDFVQTIANVGSTMIILLCTFIKVPQIMHIKQKQSAKGIYLQAILLEVSGFTIIALYNYTNQYTLITYLEYPIVLLQVYTMFYYVLKYKSMLHLPRVHICIFIYFSILAAFMTGLLPKVLLSYLMPLCPPLNGFAKITHMYGIIKAANADAVSLTTWIISVSANCARIFTVYVDSADWRLMANFIVSTTLGSGVLTSAIYYKRKTALQQRQEAKTHSHSD